MTLALSQPCVAVPPVVTNLNALQRASGQPVDIWYNLQDTDSATVRVSLQISENGGGNWTVPAQSLSGTGIGDYVVPGPGRHILWNAPADWPGHQSSTVVFRVVVNDDPILGSMAQIPAGSFLMGNSTNAAEGNTVELPVHTVYLTAFYMDRYEVTEGLWTDVRAWGLTHGYADLPVGAGEGLTHPVHSISWYSIVKWCNARSEREGLTPVYFTNDAQTVIYKTGSVNVTNAQVKWSANGYRLPTEAEWERAVRGGASVHRFPWTNVETITHSQANYFSAADLPYDISPTRMFHPTYKLKRPPYTNPVGAFAPNGYGLYDMAGNVWEWCWDWYGSTYYSTSPNTDPQGPLPGSDRVIRGGCWFELAFSCRSAGRYNILPTVNVDCVGFRAVRR